MTEDSIHVWGIDSALKGIATTRIVGDDFSISWISPHDKQVRDTWKRIRMLQKLFKEDAVAFIAGHGKPRAVFLEAPVIYDKPSVLALAQVVAVVRMVLEDLDIPCFETNVGTWKMNITLTGSATKEHIATLVRIQLKTIDQVIAALKVPRIYHEDLYDSAGVALHGRNLLRKDAAA